MKFAKDGYQVEAAIRKGRNLPDWYLNEPPQHGTDAFYMNAYWHLDTTRKLEGGPIPWDKVKEYSEFMELEHIVAVAFTQIIMVMDYLYLAYMQKTKNGK